jgi:hypothetical protein
VQAEVQTVQCRNSAETGTNSAVQVVQTEQPGKKKKKGQNQRQGRDRAVQTAGGSIIFIAVAAYRGGIQ